MKSPAATVSDYLASLPADRRAEIEAVRQVILKSLDAGFEEGMQYGMIGYYVPHSRYPAGYHCDPKQPVPFASLASQKNHLSLYMMCLYADSPMLKRFVEGSARAGKKPDMGKACVRFRRADDLALDVLADILREVTADKWIAHYEQSIGNREKKPASPKRAGTTVGKATTKRVSKRSK